MANPRAKRLAAEKHPRDDTDLATAPRRMTMRDVGGIGLGCSADDDSNVTGDERSLPTPVRPREEHALLLHQYVDVDENPFGFSLDLDDA